MITYHKGDLLKAPVDIIAHGCNCRMTMGAGIAKYISQIYPEVKRADRNFEPQKPRKRLGLIDIVQVHVVPNNRIRYVANCYTQLDFGIGEVHTNYSAVERCMKALHRYILQEDNLVLGMPKIGAGLGGGEWGIISNIIDRVFEDTPVQIWCLKR